MAAFGFRSAAIIIEIFCASCKCAIFYSRIAWLFCTNVSSSFRHSQIVPSLVPLVRLPQKLSGRYAVIAWVFGKMTTVQRVKAAPAPADHGVDPRVIDRSIVPRAAARAAVLRQGKAPSAPPRAHLAGAVRGLLCAVVCRVRHQRRFCPVLARLGLVRKLKPSPFPRPNIKMLPDAFASGSIFV